jgi:hypothetical protein
MAQRAIMGRREESLEETSGREKGVVEGCFMYESIAWNWIVLLVGVIAALLVLREVFLWYWKITKIVKLLEEHSQQNRYIIETLQSLERRNDALVSLLRTQNEHLKAQTSSEPASVADKPEAPQQG